MVSRLFLGIAVCVGVTAGVASAGTFWVYGEGRASYHDKQAAYDQAYRDAIRSADEACPAGFTTDAVATKVAYAESPPPAAEVPPLWSAQVAVREMCDYETDQ